MGLPGADLAGNPWSRAGPVRHWRLTLLHVSTNFGIRGGQTVGAAVWIRLPSKSWTIGTKGSR